MLWIAPHPGVEAVPARRGTGPRVLGPRSHRDGTRSPPRGGVHPNAKGKPYNLGCTVIQPRLLRGHSADPLATQRGGTMDPARWHHGPSADPLATQRGGTMDPARIPSRPSAVMSDSSAHPT